MIFDNEEQKKLVTAALNLYPEAAALAARRMVEKHAKAVNDGKIAPQEKAQDDGSTPEGTA